MQSVSPVLTEAEVPAEQVVALDQPQYFPIIVVRVTYMNKDGKPDGHLATMTRFRFSDKERELIASGADLVLSQPHHGPLMPIGLQLAMQGSHPVPEA